MLAGPRLRQVALAAANCDATATQLKMTFGWPEPFHDPGVSRFGLTNAVLVVGDTFVEVVAPVRPDTTWSAAEVTAATWLSSRCRTWQRPGGG